MARYRERNGNKAADSIYCGSTFNDVTLPYGDGPWVNESQKWNTSYPLGAPYYSRETCTDEVHKGPPWKEGGPLDIRRVKTDQYDVRSNVDVRYHMYRYAGGFLPLYRPTSYLDWTDPTSPSLDDDAWVDPDLLEHGASGWAKFRPGKSQADLGVFLGEIKETPRMFMTTASVFAKRWRSMGGSRRSFAPKSVANHWLNTQFGWLPFLSDMKAFYNATMNLDKAVYQLRRDNRQWIKRGGTVTREDTAETVVESSTLPGHWPTLVTYLYAGSPRGWYRVERRTTARTWFKGRFRYWIQALPTSGPKTMWEIARVYGLRPSPSLVWELTPWSWLIDWCSNAGDVIENITAMLQDGLCAKYAYVMCHRKQTVTTMAGSNLKSGPIFDQWFASCEQKVRREASPFGFGLTGLDFDARKWSILGALGLTRLRF